MGCHHPAASSQPRQERVAPQLEQEAEAQRGHGYQLPPAGCHSTRTRSPLVQPPLLRLSGTPCTEAVARLRGTPSHAEVGEQPLPGWRGATQGRGGGTQPRVAPSEAVPRPLSPTQQQRVPPQRCRRQCALGPPRTQQWLAPPVPLAQLPVLPARLLMPRAWMPAHTRVR